MIMKKIMLFVTIMTIVACRQPGKETGNTPVANQDAGALSFTPAQLTNVGVDLGVLEKRSVADLVRVNGVVDVPPANVISVSFPMGGFLKSTNLMPGKKIGKGEVIGIIEDQALVQLQQDYLMGREKQVYLQQEYDRQKQLNENNINAAKIFQQATADLNGHKVMMRGLEEKLRLIGLDPARLSTGSMSRSLPIRSPINGYVSKVLVNPGKYVQPADVLFELIDPKDVHAALTVFQKDIPGIATGQEVDINFIDRPEQHYKARIFLVTRNLDEDRSQLVHCHFVGDPGNLMPGMFLQAQIRTAPRVVNALPEEAVVGYQGRQFVFVQMADGKFSMQPVETGSREGGYIEIRKANALDSAKIVVRNAYALLGAMKNTGEDE